MRIKLTTKYTIITGCALLVIMNLYAYYNIKTIQNLFLQAALDEVDHLGETIISSTHYQMLEDDRQRVYQMMDEVGDQHDIERIRLFNKEGIISYSTKKNEVGNRIDISAEGCNGCHQKESLQRQATAEMRSRSYTNPDGIIILGVTREIRNDESCSSAACHFHKPDESVLGILDVQVSLVHMQTNLSAYRKNIVGFSFLFLILLVICLSLLTKRFVKQPVEEILQHTVRLAEGDLGTRINSPRQDELGELASSFDDMAQHLEEAQAELQNWAHTLETKVEERASEIKQMQSQLVQSAKLASLGELVAGIAHEINNPLTGILMFSSIASKNPHVDASVKADLDMISRESQRCAGIVQGLLEFSRESIPEKRMVSIHAIIDQTLELLNQQALFQDVRITRNYTPDFPEIPLDRGQIKQVFMNMIVNAGQAMPDGGELVITTGVLADEDVVFVEFSDNGSGIDEESLGKVFDPFFTTKEKKGTGLGLSISYGIIENHGGQIEVQSTVGKGTKFTVKLPIAAAERDAIDEVSSL